MAWFSALSVCAACSEEPALVEPVNSQRGCITDEQCEDGELCVFRLCSPGCESGCASGRACFDLGRGSACLRPDDNACVDDSDCPKQTACMRGRCSSPECRGDASDACPGECDMGLCHGGLAEDGGTSKPSDAGTPETCKPGATRCNDNVVMRCDSGGRFRDEQTCAYQCKNGACVGSCRAGEQRCQDRTRQSCDDKGNWIDIEVCRNSCTPGACTGGGACSEGARSCNGTSVMVCRRGQLVEAQRCDFLCQAGACTGSCVPDSHQCRSRTLYTCDAAGAWSMPVDCPNACVNGACGGDCQPGTQRCATENSFQLCNNRGQWSPGVECRGQACKNGECTGECSPGAARCEGGTSLATCSASGDWSSAVACPNQICSGDRCSGMCAPGSTRCRPDATQQPQLCTAQGSWQDAPRCAANQACVNGTCGGVCAPNLKRCDPLDEHSVQTCMPNGQWSVATPCPDALVCDDRAECGAVPSCPPDASPDWYAPGAGANRVLNDPRWGGALDRFAGGSESDPNAGGYAIVFDRPSGQLAVSLRALAEDMAGAQDYVFFGVRSDTVGAAVRLPLAVEPGASDPLPLSGGTAYELVGNAWEESQDPIWLQHVRAWVMSPEASWAVSFRVDLATIGIDPASPVRVGLGLHVENMSAEYNPATPAQLMADMPPGGMSRNWPALDLSAVKCTERVRLP